MANFSFDQAEGLRRLLGVPKAPQPQAAPGAAGAAANDTIIQVGTTPDSIKTAYGLIKRLAQQQGKRRFGVLVTGAVSQSEAKLVYDNMAAAATKYLSVQLYAVALADAPAELRQPGRRHARPQLAGSGRPGGTAHFGT